MSFRHEGCALSAWSQIFPPIAVHHIGLCSFFGVFFGVFSHNRCWNAHLVANATNAVVHSTQTGSLIILRPGTPRFEVSDMDEHHLGSLREAEFTQGQKQVGSDMRSHASHQG